MSVQPRFHCLLPVRDEADIIGQCIEHLLTWADSVHVYDTGSEDETWEIVQDVAARDRRVIPLRKEAVFFNDTLVRGWLFHQARRQMRTGDWFLRVDADEFHHVPPPEFVKSQLRSHETVVYHQYYNFVLRDSEAHGWLEGRETLADRARPIETRRQWYQPSVYSEPRLCRYRDTMQWAPTVSFPYNAGYLAVARLPIRHYPHRDPVQLERRCLLRARMMADVDNRSNWTQPDLHHWAEQDWRKMVTPDDAPRLAHWTPGTPLPELAQTNHLAAFPKRLMQRSVHACLLPLLDRCRAPWPEAARPRPLASGAEGTVLAELPSP